MMLPALFDYGGWYLYRSVIGPATSSWPYLGRLRLSPSLLSPGALPPLAFPAGHSGPFPLLLAAPSSRLRPLRLPPRALRPPRLPPRPGRRPCEFSALP